jgi:6-phosphogluconolactonase (cycloisomerase 2 family)
MLQKALVLVLVVASITGFTSCGSSANHYIYASLSAANQIIVYREDPNSGVLTQIVGSPYTVGNGVISLALHPSGKFLYAANPGTGGNAENDISLFNIASNGTLTEVFPRTSVAPAASQPELLRIDSAGAFLYVGNAGSQNISVFSIASSTGALTPVGSPFFLGTSPLNMQLTPSGNYLFVSIAGPSSGTILTFSTNSGVLTPVSGIRTDGPNPDGLAVDPSGTYLYAANYSSSGSISIFKIGTSASPGALTEVSGSPLTTGYIAPLALTLDPKGQYLYVANQGSNNVAAYSLNSTTGLPNILTTSTTTGAFATEGSPSFLVFDPSGKYLYVGNQGSSAGIQAFSVSAGNLTALSTYGVGNTPSSIVVLGK